MIALHAAGPLETLASGLLDPPNRPWVRWWSLESDVAVGADGLSFSIRGVPVGIWELEADFVDRADMERPSAMPRVLLVDPARESVVQVVSP